MPLRLDAIFPGEIYHVYNRAVEKKTIFHNSYDYGRFLMRAREYIKLFPTEVLAYCIMPNHFHFLIREPMPIEQPRTPGVQNQDTRCPPINKICRKSSLTEKFLHRLLCAYGRYYVENYSETHSGHVFQSRYKAKHVTGESSIETLMAYIHDNPVRAKLVDHPAEWAYSSYLDLTGVRPDSLVTHDKNLSDLSHQKIWEIFARDRKTPGVLDL
jgi:putative transposase